jgi:CBS domain-containing protein
MGFKEVYDYVTGKLDWLAAGLPSEGPAARLPRAGDVARKDVPTCDPAERLGPARDRVRAAGWDVCVVVNEERIVLGLLRRAELDKDGDLTIERAMRPGPSTFRPHVGIEEMAAFMAEHGQESSPITTSEGLLIGILFREDAEREAHRLHELRHQHHGEEG